MPYEQPPHTGIAGNGGSLTRCRVECLPRPRSIAFGKGRLMIEQIHSPDLPGQCREIGRVRTVGKRPHGVCRGGQHIIGHHIAVSVYIVRPVLEAVKYLLGSFISRFPKTSVPRLKDSDYRDEWSLREGLLESRFVKKPRAPYLRLWGEAEFSHAGDEPIQWDLFMKRDKTPRTSAQLPTFTGSKKINEQADWFIDRDNEGKQAPLPIIAYYNTERAVIRNKPERRRGFQKVFSRYDAYTGALDNGLNYKKTIEWFCFLEDKQRREKEAVQDWNHQTLEYRTIQLAVENMLPGFRNLRTTLGPLDLIVDIEEAEQPFKTCRIDTQLSDGYKIVLVLVLDLVSRILEANAGIPGVTPEQLLRAEGIVLIDEVDLHLHPSWQQRILGDLRRTFPCLQFIVST